MSATLARWYSNAIDFLPNLVLILLILLMTQVAARRIQSLVQRIAGRTEAPPEVADLLGRLARVGVVLVGILLVLDRLNWSRAAFSFVAGLGILGLALGFALQDIVKQFAAGVLLLMLRPFHIGDEVTIGTFEGRVMQVQLRATVLRTSRGDEVLIPNADVYTTAITNASRSALRRHTVALSIPQPADLAATRTALLQTLAQVDGVAGEPRPAIVATGFEGAASKLEARFWVDARASDSDQVTTAVVAAISQALAETAPSQNNVGAGEIKGQEEGDKETR